MIDLHSHVLPGIDDGCRSPEESIAALQLLKRQGVTTVCATPHFYAERTDPVRFLKKREESFLRLIQKSAEEKNNDTHLGLPISVKLGAEVLYFTGISQTGSVLTDLCYEDTDMLLLEMPFHDWSNQVIDEVLTLQNEGRVRLCLAHVDRYWDYAPVEVFEIFKREGIRFQMNCDAFLGWRSRRKALNAVKHWQIDYLTSDTHNLKERAPHFDEAFAVLEKKKLFAQCEAFRERSIWE